MKTSSRKSMASRTTPTLPPFHQNKNTAHPAIAGSANTSKVYHIPACTSFHNPKFKIQNQKSRSPRRPAAAFTLIELMAATTVLSIILLMMVGMQDQMSRAWSNSNRRTDATREARAAARMMAADLGGMIYRPNTLNSGGASGYDNIALILTNQGLPYLYSSNGTGPITITNAQSGSAYLFALCNQASRGTNYTDIGLVGYYIASSGRTNINGFVVTNYNLHRYYVPASNAVGNLTSWFANRTVNSLFSGVNPATDDILARNTCNLRITFFGKGVTNGLNYSNNANPSSIYRGNKAQVEWTTYPEDVAQKIAPADWANSANIQKFGRSFEFRLDVRRN